MVKYHSAKLTPETRRAMECAGKEAFRSYRIANRVARAQNRRHDKLRFTVYPCQHCGQFHIGSAARKPPKPEPMTDEEEREWEWIEKRNTWR